MMSYLCTVMQCGPAWPIKRALLHLHDVCHICVPSWNLDRPGPLIDCAQSNLGSDAVWCNSGLCVGRHFRTLCGAPLDFLWVNSVRHCKLWVKDCGYIFSSPSNFPIHPNMTAVRQTAPDLLTTDEKAILAIAVRLDSALRHIEQHREAVDDENFIGQVNKELVSC
jgi:hypothetical protein